jgi:DNA-binding LacI/PurR family transcriptional regulator
MTSTISDVAKRAGVSTATVSRFLSGESIRSAERVQTAIDALGYQPAFAARSLRSGVHYAVAMIVPDITNPYFASLAKGVESVLRSTPYRIFLCNTDESTETEEAVLQEVLGRVDGIILAPAAEHESAPLRVRKKGMPIVLVDRELSSKVFDSVLVDNIGGAQIAARYLVGLGHSEIAIISGPLRNTPGKQRYHGFLKELDKLGINSPEQFAQVSDFKESGGFDAMRRLLELANPPTAVFCANNVMTIGALKALNALDVAISEQISIIGFDDLDLASLLHSPLTVIDRPSEEQGAIAARLLLNRLENGTLAPKPERTVLPVRLIERRSCAGPRRVPLISKRAAGKGAMSHA